LPPRQRHIVDGGDESIADSNFIIDHLKKKYGDPLDAKLDPTVPAPGARIQADARRKFLLGDCRRALARHQEANSLGVTPREWYVAMRSTRLP
jgi:glutathione S-transferase